MDYKKADAKAWAQANWRGVTNVILPSFTADLSALNEQAIRHDVRRNIELGFWGALLVSECATTMDEYVRFMEIAVDEAKGRQKFLIHGTFDTAEDIVKVAAAGESIGMEGLLLGHPNSFYPTSDSALFDYLKFICDNTNFAVCLFAAGHWNYKRLHPSGYPFEVLAKACDFENVVAAKYEVGRPGIAGDYQFWKLIKDKDVLFSDPFEPHLPLSVEMFGQRWMGTSNYEYYGDYVPRLFDLLQNGDYDKAMELYWSLEPLRAARAALNGTVGGANFIHRYLWKYQAWLHGYNGGPMRQPIMKLTDGQMNQAKAPMAAAGYPPRDGEGPADFYVGRNPA